MSLNAKEILNNFEKGIIDYESMKNSLVFLLERSKKEIDRLETIQIINKLNINSDKIYQVLENSLISDSSEKVRALCAKTLKKLFLEKSLKPLKWALMNEKTLACTIAILSILGEIETEESKQILLDNINTIDGKQYKYNLKEIIEDGLYQNFNTKQLAEILINYYIISSLKLKLGYLKFEENEKGEIVKLDLSGIDTQGLRSNKVSKSLQQILSLSLLKHLDISNNDLLQLEIRFPKENYLEIIDLSYNRLYSLPNSIGSLKKLKKLILKSNKLKSLPNSLKKLESLEILILRDNLLRALPSSIGVLKRLKILDLYHNKLSSLPKNFEKLESLLYLDLGWNRFHKIPHFIGKCKKIEKLSLGRNNISRVPDWIRELECLKVFNIYDNHLQHFPSIFGEIDSLEELNLRNNQLKMLPENLIHLKNLKVLNLSWNQIENLPAWIGCLDSLEELNLWRNNLSEIPETIKNLRNLKSLYLNFNNFSKPPDILRELKENGVHIKV
ncbi:MAG: Leucine-rich repeat domain protein [Promethearchaeota archaeon]|nr:MAG: Leucine-rich repeat domain protein [Candidatus Lokiarchaeota archaeon]